MNETNLSLCDIAVILPCYNEGHAICAVVKDMIRALPNANVHVFDNNSTDNTIEQAQNAGATVHRVAMQGKGNVVRQAFALIDADVYVIADGDGTYDASAAPKLVRVLIDDELDMVVGARRETNSNAYRYGHRAGNWLFTGSVRMLFGRDVRDLFSGYRVFSRPFVKSFPAMATGFETETELFFAHGVVTPPICRGRTALRRAAGGVREQAQLNSRRRPDCVLCRETAEKSTTHGLLRFICNCGGGRRSTAGVAGCFRVF